MCVCACLCACVRACERACVRACMRACVFILCIWVQVEMVSDVCILNG